jgi:nucleotide-binding universal stress UspA family protein
MSEQGRPKVLEEVVIGDWWVIAAQIEKLVSVVLLAYHRGLVPSPAIIYPKAEILPHNTAYAGTIYAIDRTSNEPLAELGEYWVSIGRESTAIVRILPAQDEYIDLWKDVLAAVRVMGAHGRRLRRRSIGPTVDAVIGEFERAKAAGEQMTLKQLAEDAGISYKYVRKRKSMKENARRAGNKQSNTD